MDPRWEKQYILVKKYVEIHDALPKYSKDINIAQWVSRQIRHFSEGKLNVEKFNLLNEIKHWKWLDQKNSWMKEYLLVIEFVKTNNRLPRYVEGKSGRWVVQQRHKYRNNKLSPENISLLEKIDHWIWEGVRINNNKKRKIDTLEIFNFDPNKKAKLA